MNSTNRIGIMSKYILYNSCTCTWVTMAPIFYSVVLLSNMNVNEKIAYSNSFSPIYFFFIIPFCICN